MLSNIVPSSPEQIASMSERAREVVRLNIEALEALERSIDVSLARACDIIMGRPGYVVVTGMGMVTSLGQGKEDNWAKLTAGQSGIHRITRFPVEGMRTTIAGTVDFLFDGRVPAPDLEDDA